MNDDGIAVGNGTEEDRARYRALLKTLDERESRWQQEILKLSSHGRYSRTTRSRHNIKLTQPELIAEEICWVGSGTRLLASQVLVDIPFNQWIYPLGSALLFEDAAQAIVISP